MPRKLTSNKIRFWSKVNIGSEAECWNWKASVNSTGRGAYSIGRKNIKAHRMAWELTNGEIPAGLLVCHRCDNGKCCNPSHLFLGTYADNFHDMMAKGRKKILRGEEDPKSKLTTKQVIEIRKLYRPWKYSQFRLAREFGVSRSTIESIIHRVNWRSVP